MQTTTRWTARGKVWILLALGALAVFLLRDMLWSLTGQVMLGTVLAYALSPVCKALEKRLPRGLAAFASLLLLVAVLVAFVTLLVPPLVAQVQLLLTQVPTLIQQIRDLFDGLEERLAGIGLPSLVSAEAWQRLAQFSGLALTGLAQSAGGMASALARLSLAVVLAYYFLKDREFFLHRLAMCVPLKYRQRAILAAAEMRREVGGYLRGQMLVAVFVGAMTALGLLVLGIPAWLALGLMMAVLDLIPYFGPFLGAVPILLFSLPGGISRVLWALGVVLVVQQLEGNVVSPRLIGRHTGLHPVTVLLSLTTGGALWGVMGMLVALPVVLAVRGCVRVLRCYEEPAHPL